MAAHFSARQASAFLVIAIVSMALAGCRHEVPVHNSIKDSPPVAAAKPAAKKSPVKKSPAAIQKAEAGKEAVTKVAADPKPIKAAATPEAKPAAASSAKASAAPAPVPASATPAAVPAKQAAAPVVPAVPAPPAAPKASAAAAAAPAGVNAAAATAAAGSIAEGRKLFIAGKVQEARKRLTAQLVASPADANLALAQTFDPHYVTQLKTSDAGPDIGRALQLYTTAVQSGSKDAEPDLARLRTSLGLPPK